MSGQHSAQLGHGQGICTHLILCYHGGQDRHYVGHSNQIFWSVVSPLSLQEDGGQHCRQKSRGGLAKKTSFFYGRARASGSLNVKERGLRDFANLVCGQLSITLEEGLMAPQEAGL